MGCTLTPTGSWNQSVAVLEALMIAFSGCDLDYQWLPGLRQEAGSKFSVWPVANPRRAQVCGCNSSTWWAPLTIGLKRPGGRLGMMWRIIPVLSRKTTAIAKRMPTVCTEWQGTISSPSSSDRAERPRSPFNREKKRSARKIEGNRQIPSRVQRHTG